MATTKTGKRAPRKAPAKTSTKKRTVAASKKSVALVRKAQPKTLVTGGTGFLGAHLVRQLLEDDGVKNLRVMATAIPAWLTELGVETIEGSITKAEDVARAVEGVAEIYHLAGRVSRDHGDARQMYAIHVDGTRLLCEAARGAGVRSIVMASTSGTIAVTEKGDVIPDEDWPPPLEIISRWPYYASKYYQERTALENFSGRGQRLVLLNPSLLLGPGDERLSSTQVILDFLAQKIRVAPTGGLSFVDARDVAAAFRAAMKQGRHGERYLLGSANWSFKEFLGRLERLTKTRAPNFSLPSKLAVTGAKFLSDLWRQWDLAPPIEPATVEMAEHFWYLDAAKARSELGFTPRDPAETLQDTIQYVRENFLGNTAFRK